MSKYHNRKTTIDNITFDSLKEAVRYTELKLKLKAKEIHDLQIQPVFVLQEGFTDQFGKKHRPITYIADFSYYEKHKDGYQLYVVEDVKGMKTLVYQIKKKLLLYKYGTVFTFREI